MDGQRSIYLQQLRHLPRDRYDMWVLNMAAADEEEEDKSAEVFINMLKELQVPFVRKQKTLQLSMEEGEVRRKNQLTTTTTTTTAAAAAGDIAHTNSP